jgi:hypothetical protein
MNAHKVKFTIPKGGGISFEVIDGQGQSCTQVTKNIELHLSQAGTKISEQKKPEYYEDGPDLNVFQTMND